MSRIKSANELNNIKNDCLKKLKTATDKKEIHKLKDTLKSAEKQLKEIEEEKFI